jgi:aminoglycoside phosphotransferase (APT) family kinase protein
MLQVESPRADLERYLGIASTKAVPQLTQSQANTLRVACDRYVETLGEGFEPVSVHADLSREHILAEHRTISGVIDFGDVNLGDADYDFLYLFLDCGWRFAEAVARRYGHSNLEQLRTKLRYFAIVDQIDTIACGPGMALVGQERRAWTRLRQLLDADSGV